jgi:hypothetical protein
MDWPRMTGPDLCPEHFSATVFVGAPALSPGHLFNGRPARSTADMWLVQEVGGSAPPGSTT